MWLLSEMLIPAFLLNEQKTISPAAPQTWHFKGGKNKVFCLAGSIKHMQRVCRAISDCFMIVIRIKTMHVPKNSLSSYVTSDE